MIFFVTAGSKGDTGIFREIEKVRVRREAEGQRRTKHAPRIGGAVKYGGGTEAEMLASRAVA